MLIRNMAIDNKSMEQLAEWSGGKVLSELVELAISRTPCEPSSSRHATFAISNIAAAGEGCCGGDPALRLSACCQQHALQVTYYGTWHQQPSRCRSGLGLGCASPAGYQQAVGHLLLCSPANQPVSRRYGTGPLPASVGHAAWLALNAASASQLLHAVPSQLVP